MKLNTTQILLLKEALATRNNFAQVMYGVKSRRYYGTRKLVAGRKLIEQGLFIYDPDPKPYDCGYTVFYLTEKGKKVASLL